MEMIRTFEDLACCRAPRELRRTISGFCRTLPKVETYRLKDQMIRASRSVTANIAAGFDRHHRQENMQFCRQARGSLFESLEHLNPALDEAYASEREYAKPRLEVGQVLKILNGYIAYLQRCVKSGVPQKPHASSTIERKS